MRYIQWIVWFWLLLLAPISYASQEDDWLRGLEHPTYEHMSLRSQNLLQKYISRDFSSVLTPRTRFLGYIGNKYKRLHIYLKSISRDPKSQNRYLVVGKSIVGRNVNTFDGDITITSVREYQHMHYGVDDELKDSGIQSEGLLIGKYKFGESRSQPHSGTFEGIVTAYWYVNKSGKLRYDDISASYSDSYMNNQYVGTWASYNTGRKKVANWGERRIPFSGDLDIGASEFFANPKYIEQGWGDMLDPYQ